MRLLPIPIALVSILGILIFSYLSEFYSLYLLPIVFTNSIIRFVAFTSPIAII